MCFFLIKWFFLHRSGLPLLFHVFIVDLLQHDFYRKLVTVSSCVVEVNFFVGFHTDKVRFDIIIMSNLVY